MLNKVFYFIRKSDWPMTLTTFFLVAYGLMAIYSIEAANQSVNFLNFKKQIIFFAAGLLLMIFLSVLDYRYFKTYSFVIYGLGVLLLLSVLLAGTTIKGTRGWLYFFGEQGFQPVELIKLIMIIILAKFFSDWRAEVKSLKNLGIIFMVAAPLIILVFLQPDFGSAFILVAIFIGMLLMTKIKKSYLLVLLLIFITLIFSSWFFVLKNYQKDRVLTLFNPNRDPYKSGYNIKQSIIAVGSGEFFGRGLSFGPQSRLKFLPVQETDFVFAVIAEELGFVGAALLLAAMFMLTYRLLRISRKSRDDFGIFLTGGVVIYFFSQSLLNIGMNIGILPIAGVPLPLVSYGGSSLIVSFIMLGIVQSVYVRNSQLMST